MRGDTNPTYPAVWAEPGDAPRAGAAALTDEGLSLTGGSATASSPLVIRYEDVVSVSIVRDPEQRLNGLPTLAIDRRGVPPLRLCTIGLGVLGELNELLADAVASSRPDTIAVVVPLRAHGRADAEALIARGPPFDLEGLEISEHDVLLSGEEVVFLFRGVRLLSAIDRLASDPSVWRAASEWARLSAAPPRLAVQLFPTPE
jgi:hypothetical protein